MIGIQVLMGLNLEFGSEDVARLEEAFSVDEVFFTLFELSGDKASGLNGFS